MPTTWLYRPKSSTCDDGGKTEYEAFRKFTLAFQISLQARQVAGLVGEGHQDFLPPVVLIFPAQLLADIPCQLRVQDAERLLHFGVIVAHFLHSFCVP